MKKTSDCDCVILCGGLGKRLRGVVADVPKVMAAVNGRPFLDLVIEYLKGQNIKRIVLCTGYKADMLEDYYREHDFGLTIDFSREQEPLGTGGALKNAQEIISSGLFFVFNGDSFLPADLTALLKFHARKGAMASMVVSQVDIGKDFGSLKLDEQARIIGFHEKVEGRAKLWVNAGIYCFDRAIFSLMPTDKKFSLENDFFPKLAGSKFYGYRVEQKFIDIGTPERYALVQQSLSKGHNSGD